MSSLSSASSASSSSASSVRSAGSSALGGRRARVEVDVGYDVGGSGSGSGQGGAGTNTRGVVETARERDTAAAAATVAAAGGLGRDPLSSQSIQGPGGFVPSGRSSGSRGQTWEEFLLEGGVVDSDRERERERNQTTLDRRRSATVTMDRKRRLTGTGEDISRRRSLNGGAGGAFASGSGSGGRLEPRIRPSQPLPTLRAGEVHTAAGSSSDNVIDLSGSPEAPRLPDPPTHHDNNNNLFEYSLPRWQPDSEVSRCPICDTQFGFFFRKHHCRKCGRVVCASCSPHRITIPRQFIVCPPDQLRFPLPSTFAPNPSDAHVIDLTGDESSPQTTYTQSNHSRQLPNPGLGGGEEVRLCNPCVPDPNPEPLRGYGGVGSPQYNAGSLPSIQNWGAHGTGLGGHVNQAGLRRSSLANYYGGSPGWNNVSGHRSHHSTSAVNMPRTDAERELRRQRGRGMIFQPETPGMQRAAHAGLPDEGLPSYGSFDYTVVPNFRGQPPRYQPSQHSSHPHHSPPAYSSPISVPNTISSHHRNQSHGLSNSPGSSRSFRGRTIMYDNNDPTSSGHHNRRRRHIDEADICPICNHLLPPRAPDGTEEAREEHIRTCITDHGRGGQGQSQSGPSPNRIGSPPRPSAAPTRMLPFVATEKDCVGEDGNELECTICMVEYEVGDDLARLECLCKFHKRCIVEWFGRKQECPVHKVS